MKTLKNWKVILAVMLVFGAGYVTSSVVKFLQFKHFLNLENRTEATMKSLHKELHLSPEQETKVREIVQENEKQSDQAFGQAIRISGTNKVDSWRKIDQVLKPEERVIFRRDCEKFREKTKKDFHIELPPARWQGEQK